jgi:predicted porin
VATAPLGAAELRASYGELENDTRGLKTDKQFGLGYHYAISKRTTLYADYVRQDRDGIVNASGSARDDMNIPTLEQLAKMNDLSDRGKWVAEEFADAHA